MTRKQILDQFFKLVDRANRLDPDERLATLGEMESYLTAELDIQVESDQDVALRTLVAALRADWGLTDL